MNEWEWHLLEDKAAVDHLVIAGAEVRVGHHVRVNPRPGGDVMDLALAGRTATVEAIEQDYEGRQNICVVLDDDPGRDLGLLRQPGHRFFFDPTEIEPLSDNASWSPGSATSFLVMMLSEWRPSGACLNASFRRRSAWLTSAFADLTLSTRFRIDMTRSSWSMHASGTSLRHGVRDGTGPA